MLTMLRNDRTRRMVLAVITLGLLGLCGLSAPRLSAETDSPDQIVYGRDIRPILSNRCFACHGPDEGQRQADLRLDVRESAVEMQAIVPGKPDASSLVERVGSDDEFLQMPPPDSHKKPLNKAEQKLLSDWIAQGAPYAKHWAYTTPTRPAVPEVRNADWPVNAIDHFVARQHERRGLKPAAEADRRTLVRRLFFDLVGLPPTPGQVDAFVNDASPNAYANLVERLLESPHFGERMAAYWLDLVRYADTCGYHSDNHRDVAAYRDYVIQAFNSNKPYDQFTIEQLAGDLLPHATLEQKVASGYNRLLQTTEEGGAQRKEYLAIYAADRVRNVSTVWMGTTLGCCQCHNHKYDPFTMRDFYSLSAFFADLKETVPGRQPANLRMPTPEQTERIRELQKQIAEVEPIPVSDEQLADWIATLRDAEQRAQLKDVKLSAEEQAALETEAAQRSDTQRNLLIGHCRAHSPALTAQRKQLADLKQQLQAVQNSVQTMLVSESTEPRMVRILPRGNWLDDSGDVVEPDTPASLFDLSVGDRRANRLDLARWITSRDNPLTARVFVNRLWYLMFGRGISSSLEDVGHQGQWPTHPELLDWLAVEFMDSGWDVKHMLRLMAHSRTYRQSSDAAPDEIEQDPYNQWLTRQNAFRLNAEQIRDAALAVSGLLVEDLGSPRSVKPYQPAGYWKHLNFPKREYHADTGRDQYRRGVYTYWCRTFPHPSLTTFDAPSREECTAERPRSNTPLQALVLLNDPTYVEAARAFATRMLAETSDSPVARTQWAFREAISREPTGAELKILRDVAHHHARRYASDPEAAHALLNVGQSPVPEDLDAVELAVWTSVARVILNLHEFITRS